MFVDFTMTLDEKIDYNDKETFNNQEIRVFMIY